MERRGEGHTLPPAMRLLSDPQLGDEGAVTLDILPSQVVQKAAALTNHLVQAAAAVVVMDMDLARFGYFDARFDEAAFRNTNLKRDFQNLYSWKVFPGRSLPV